MDHHQVRDAEAAGELPLGLHALEEADVPHQAPCLVVNDPAPAAAGVGEGGFHPGARAGHREDEGGVVPGAAEAGQVDGEHRRVRIEGDGGGGVEHAGQVAVDQAPHGVGQVAGCVAELARHHPGGLVERMRVVEGGGDFAEERGAVCVGGAGDDGVERDVQGGVLHGHQVPAQDSPGQGAEQEQAPLADLADPVGLGHALRARGRVQGVQATGQSGTEGDGPAAEGFGHWRPLALRVARHVDAVSEGDRPQREGLGQRALALADHPGEQQVRVGEALDATVQGERVEDE